MTKRDWSTIMSNAAVEAMNEANQTDSPEYKNIYRTCQVLFTILSKNIREYEP